MRADDPVPAPKKKTKKRLAYSPIGVILLPIGTELAILAILA
jgi:hypothetical protein